MSIYLGTKKVKGIYLGTQKVKAVYLGTDKVFSSAPAPVPVDYVSSITNGNGAYLDLGEKPNLNTKVEVTFAIITAPSNKISQYCGVAMSASSSLVMAALTSTGATATSYFGAKTDANTATAFPANTKLWSSIDKNNFTVKRTSSSGSSVYSATLGQTTAFTATGNAYLFGVHGSSGLYGSVGTIRVYECKWYNGSTLAHDWKACRDPNGVPTMYDTVTETYLTPHGTFTANE